MTQKSGVGYALDPDRRGKCSGNTAGAAAARSAAFGVRAVDGKQAYFAVADQLSPAPGGLHAVSSRPASGLVHVPPQPPVCARGPGCSAAQSAARHFDPGRRVLRLGRRRNARVRERDGKILWTFDTNRDFDSVNGVKADGGSIDGPGPVVAGGMLYVTAGNAGFVGTPGNVLLAFGLD